MQFFIRTVILTATLAASAVAQPPQEDKRLIFSTYQGGDRNDDAQSVAVDGDGNIYVIGETESRDLPSTPVGGKPLTAAVFKAYIAKYAPNGKEVLWRKMIGGSSNTVAHAVALDASGNVYVAGTSGAKDLPMLNAVQTQQNGLNIAYLMKFDPKGELLFSTFIGGNRNEEGNALAIDSQGNIYLAGRASSENFPVKNALQPKMAGGGQDAFIAKFTPDYQLAYATYFGGTSGTDNIFAIAIGPDDSLYVTGENMSPAMATEGAYIAKPPSYSSYVAKINPEGTAVTYFTYVGWNGGYTKAQALAVDSLGRAYAAGHTSSKQLPTSENAIQKTFAGGMRDGFLVRLDANATAAEYITYLGGSYSGPSDPDESVTAIKVDQRGHVVLTGQTNSQDFPGRRPLQNYFGGMFDAYLVKLDLDNSQIIYSTFWGGAKRDTAAAIALGPGETVTVAGESYSDDLPLARAVQTKLGSLNDSFLAQICDPWPGVWLGDRPAAEFAYVIGGERPQAIEALVYTGCPQKFDVVDITADQPWIALVKDGDTAPLKLKIEVNVDGLPAGEYNAIIRATVPDAFYKTIEIPVKLVVTEPPPPEEPMGPTETTEQGG